MTKFLQKVAVIVVTFLLISCGINDSLKTVVVEDKYQMDIPITFIEQKKINEEASFLYGNPFSELYAMVFDERYVDFIEDKEVTLEDFKESSVEDFLDVFIEHWAEMGLEVTYEDCKDIQINDLPAIFVEKEAVIENIKVNYHIAIIKGEKALYHVYLWTTPDRKEKHQQMMHNILHSFKEL